MAFSDNLETRKLAAIMFTDIKGFSKKMAENETIAFEMLKTHDALLRVLAAKFDGRIIKSIGDSFMIDFTSAVNAVRCAIEAQKRFSHFNKGKSEFEKIEIRVGIHLGDVIIRGEDIIGDGVNIASRIEAMAEPNRIWISQDVYQQIRKKIPIKVFSLGPQPLKNIPEPVEIYEILIDSIAELAKPSTNALETKEHTQKDRMLQIEDEEAREAKRVEEAKWRTKKDLGKAEEEKKKKIAEHYTIAEKYYEEGKLEEAESELNEVYRLDPQQRINAERRKAEVENEKIAQVHLSKARELLSKGQLDEAENEVNEIFRLFPLHVGAQGMLLEIEDERYRREEQERTKHITEQPKVITEDKQQIDEFLRQARAQLQEEKFSDATLTLHELFLIDPNNSDARRLEENIQQAEKAKAELLRIEAEHAEEEKHLHELANLQRKLEERKQRQIRVIKQIDRRAHFERLIYIAITAFLLIVAIFGIPKLLDLAFPKTASIAILRFTSTTNDTSDSEILEVLPILLTEDLARCEHLTVIAPSTSLCYTPEPSQLKTITSQLLVDYLLLGTIQENRGHYSVTIQLFNSEQQRIANIGKLEGSLSTLSQVRIAILQAALKTMEIKSNLPEIKQSININAYTKYLKGIYQLQKESESAIDSAKILLRATIKTDTTFSLAYAAFAEAELRTNNLTDDPNSLRSAVEYAQRALRISPTIAIAHKVLGTSFRRIQKYDAALSSFSLSLEYLPQNPECYRELALLALTAGKYDYAIKYATNALNHDPQNPKSHLTLGLVQHLRKEYLLATNSYQKASQLGESDSILTVRYLMNAWIGDGKYENAIRYCQKMLSTSMRDYQYYYWLGRTYQLELKINIAQQWLQEGLSIIQKSIESNPNDTVAFAYAGLFYSRLGRFAEGEAAMNQAIQLDSSSAKILFRSANLYSIQRNKQKALTALNKGLQKKYDITELLNPDLSFILSEPEFLTTITREIKGYWPKK